MMFSEAAVEQGLIDMTNSHHKNILRVCLHVSIFDAQGAIHMMLENRWFDAVYDVHVTPKFQAGRFSIEDTMNETTFEAGNF